LTKHDDENKSPTGLFVYGSLMQGFFNYKKSLAGKVISNTPGRLKGILYHQNRKGYPAIVQGDTWVKGEFIEVDDFESILASCDEIERYTSAGNPDNEYERRTSAVELETGETVFAHVYWYARKDLGSEENPVTAIPSGDWREYMNKQKSEEKSSKLTVS